MGITIELIEVRLKPRIKDPYVWKVLPGKEEFFSGIFAINLSNYFISTYRVLCRKVRHSFEAVLSVRKKGVLVRGQNTTLSELNRGCGGLNWHSQFSPFTLPHCHKYNRSSLAEPESNKNKE